MSGEYSHLKNLLRWILVMLYVPIIYVEDQRFLACEKRQERLLGYPELSV
jgi:hypothetical protein